MSIDLLDGLFQMTIRQSIGILHELAKGRSFLFFYNINSLDVYVLKEI